MAVLLGMTAQVIVLVDDSPPAHRALEFALTEYPTADITLMCVVVVPDADSYRMLATDQFSDRDTIQQKRYQEAQQIIASAEETASDHRGEVSSRIVAGMPAETLISYAEDTDTDHLVIGLHEKTTSSQLLSSSVT